MEHHLDALVVGTGKLFGEEIAEKLSSMAMVGLARTLGSGEMAEELQMQVMKIGARVLGDEHPSTLTSINIANRRSWRC